MAKYKYISESKLDNFLQKVFKKAFDQNKSASMKKIRKQDPELAKAMDKSAKIAQDYRKNVLDKMSPKEREKKIKDYFSHIKNR